MTDNDRDVAREAARLALAAAESNTLTDQSRPTSTRDLRTPEERKADDDTAKVAADRLRL